MPEKRERNLRGTKEQVKREKKRKGKSKSERQKNVEQSRMDARSHGLRCVKMEMRVNLVQHFVRSCEVVLFMLICRVRMVRGEGMNE
jgi:hypothetical protein